MALLIGSPSQPYQAAATRRLLRNAVWLIVVGLVAIAGLMVTVDIPVISAMPARGSPELWPVRYFTGLARDWYVLPTIGVALLIAIVLRPAIRGEDEGRLAFLEVRIVFLLIAVGVPNVVGTVIKGLVGRGRPFVGGAANAFNFSPLSWRESFSSLPSAHAMTAFALAYAVAALWPQTRYVMAAYALLIAASRVVLLAHHPSDVVAGALVGILGAMAVQYWFALRGLGFVIRADGGIDLAAAPSR